MPLIRFVPHAQATTYPLEKYVFYTQSHSDQVNNEIIKMNTNISLIGMSDLELLIKHLIGESTSKQPSLKTSEFNKLQIDRPNCKYHGELLNRFPSLTSTQTPPSLDLFKQVANKYNSLLKNENYYFYEIGIDIHLPALTEPQQDPNFGKPRGNIEIKFAKIKRDHQNNIIIGSDGLPEVDKDRLFLLNEHVFFSPNSRLEITKSTIDTQHIPLQMRKFNSKLIDLEMLSSQNYLLKQYKITHAESKNTLLNIQKNSTQNPLLFTNIPEQAFINKTQQSISSPSRALAQSA
jgi:hypothetical protein